AIRGVDCDPEDDLGAPTGGPGGWQLVADSGVASWDTSRCQAWIATVTTSGPQTVTFPLPEDVTDNHARLIVLPAGTEIQAFTVARSVNGIVKPHSAGTPVRVAEPLRLAP